MHKLISMFAVPVFFLTTVAAQGQQESPCGLRFAVAEKDDGWGVWPDDARQWWAKDGKKKFPELCEAAREHADFVVAWERHWIREQRAKAIVVKDKQPIVQRVCFPSADGTSESCQDYTDYQEVERQDWEWQDVLVERLSLTVYWARAEAEKSLPVASITKNGLPSLGAKPGKGSFESAMKALRKQTKKSAAAKLK